MVWLAKLQTTRFAFVGFILLITTLGGCSQAPTPASAPPFTTEYGLGPDKWATAWLLTHANAGARLEVAPLGSPLKPGIAFDSPSAQIRRVGNKSAFEVARELHAANDQVIEQMAKIVHEIEVNYWSSSGPPEADVVENAFRQLQLRYGRDSVSPSCYVAFFDRVHDLVRAAQLDGIPLTAERLELACDELEQLSHKGDDLVAEVPIVDVLAAAAAGKRVVFVDVRESDEYEEAHIPGAINLQLRDVGRGAEHQLGSADLVVSYCVKDFRGFEMARALADAGVQNSVIMRPYGIKGWIAMGLPVSGKGALSESDASMAFESCLEHVGACVMQRDQAI